MIVIGLSGKAEHGKTTAAKYAEEIMKDNWNIGIVPLAKKMKDQAKMLGWDGEKDVKGRRFLQEISWPIKHYFGEDIYAKWCLDTAKDERLDVLLIDDVRMLAEVNYFKQAEKDGLIDKFIMVRINRPNHISKLTVKQLQDVSETQLDVYADFKYKVENNGTIEELGEKILKIVRKEVKEIY